MLDLVFNNFIIKIYNKMFNFIIKYSNTFCFFPFVKAITFDNTK